MLVTSTPSIEGKQIHSYLGIVMGSTVRARHLGTDILATLKNIVGGSKLYIETNPAYYEKLESK